MNTKQPGLQGEESLNDVRQAGAHKDGPVTDNGCKAVAAKPTLIEDLRFYGTTLNEHPNIRQLLQAAATELDRITGFTRIPICITCKKPLERASDWYRCFDCKADVCENCCTNHFGHSAANSYTPHHRQMANYEQTIKVLQRKIDGLEAERDLQPEGTEAAQPSNDAALLELLKVIDERDAKFNLFDCPSGGWIRSQLKIALSTQPLGYSSQEKLIKHMVDRFLSWKLPENFDPDGYISFTKFRNLGTSYQQRNEPSGTNLFDVVQAEAMVRYMVEDAPLSGTGAVDQAQPLGHSLQEPFLPADLEGDTTPRDWHERALRALAGQLTFANDFYYPLLGAVQKLEAAEASCKEKDAALVEAIRDEREQCAKIADSFTCGLCGMDGRSAAKIRARAALSQQHGKGER